MIYRPAESIHQCQVTAERLSSDSVGSVSSWCPEGTCWAQHQHVWPSVGDSVVLTHHQQSVCLQLSVYNLHPKYDTDPVTEIKDFFVSNLIFKNLESNL